VRGLRPTPLIDSPEPELHRLPNHLRPVKGRDRLEAIPTLAVTTNDRLAWSLRHPKCPRKYSSAQRAGCLTLVAHPLTARDILLLPVPALENQVPAFALLSKDGGAHFEPLSLGRGWEPTGGDGLLYALEGGVPLGGTPPAQGQLMISRDGGHRFVSTGVTGSMLDVLGPHSWLLTGPNPWSDQVSPMRDG